MRIKNSYKYKYYYHNQPQPPQPLPPQPLSMDYLTTIDDYLLSYIVYFLPNEDIFTLEITSSRWNTLFKQPLLRENIIYRRHPIVFNQLSNYCFVCNLRMTIIIEKDNQLNVTSCNHLQPPPTNTID